MTLSPLIEAGPLVAVHALSATAALLLGPLVVLRRRRDRLHRWAGYAWVGAMALTALTALGIHEIRLFGPFSPIHLLVGLVAVNLWRAIAAARAGRMVEHGRTMAQLYIWTMGVAGAFTLLPGRRMNAVLFGGESWAGFALGAALLAALAVVLWRAQPLPARRETPFSSPGPSAKRAGSAVVAELVDAQR